MNTASKFSTMQVLIQVEIPDLHKQIYDIRNRAGLTQNQLSQRAEMSFQNIQRIERGEEKGGAKSIPIETLEQVLEALGLPSDELTDTKQKAIALIAKSLQEILEQAALPTS